jgi:hypothetical protein
MRWFRSRNSEIVTLALFALVCQVALSFGHVHPQRSGSTGWALATEQGKAVAGRFALADLPAPGQKDPSGLGDEFCAICANVSLAGALVVPVAPGLRAKNPDFNDLHWALAASEARSIGYFHFDARGPPAA